MWYCGPVAHCSYSRYEPSKHTLERLKFHKIHWGRLNNNRAVGLSPETITDCFNNIFETHENLKINSGDIVALPKPGKPKGPVKNLRPFTLLNTIRQFLSFIALERIRFAVLKYISSGQSSFQPNKSTANVVWTHQWLAAKCSITQGLKVHITGIDMPAAFDTINCNKLLHILSDIVNEDELIII